MSRRFSCLALAVITAWSTYAWAQPHSGFRVASINVRNINSADTGEYTWANREEGVLASIRSNDPDVFGVQEASSPIILNALSEEFTDYNSWRPDGGSPKMIFYKPEVFEPLNPPQQGNHRFTNPYPESEDCYSNANGRTAGWIKLRDKQTQSVYLFVNIHVAHAAACWLARNSAAEELHELFAEELDVGETLVIFGDFNTDSQRAGVSDEDQMIQILETPQPGYALKRSARWSGNTTAATMTYNSSWKSPSTNYSRLDYIMVSSHTATTYRQATDSRTILDLLGSGPDFSPSDHFLIRAEIRTAPFVRDGVETPLEVGERQEFAFGDVNNDGAQDLVAWSTTSDSIALHIAAIGSTFSQPAQMSDVPVGEHQLADLTGDGCADLITIPSLGALQFQPSVCDGSFGEPQELPLEQVRGHVWSFREFNDDECADAVVWQQAQDGKTVVSIGRCDGTFDAPIVSSDAGVSNNPITTIGFADVNADGIADKLFWDLDQFSGRTQVYLGDGAGDFAFHHEQGGGSSRSTETRMFYGDVDGDGMAEKAFWRPNYREGYIQLYPGDNGLSSHPMFVNSGVSTHEDNVYALADINGDGSADLVRWLKGASPVLEVFNGFIATRDPVTPLASGVSGADTPDTPDMGTEADMGTDLGSIPDGSDMEEDGERTHITATEGCSSAPSRLPANPPLLVVILGGVLFRLPRGDGKRGNLPDRL